MENTPFEEQKHSEHTQHSDHSSRLEAIDREQRRMEAAQQSAEVENDSQAFTKPMVEALNGHHTNVQTPLLTQEEIDDTESPRVNWTAVICTAIVAVSAAVVLCVAKPWQRGDAEQALAMAESTEYPMDSVPLIVADEQPAAQQEVVQEEIHEEATEVVAVSEKNIDSAQAAQTVKPAETTLPVEKVVTTGTDNPYNSIRLINASNRQLTKAELDQMSKAELALARNAIYARHGYQFNNPQLREFFARQRWFKPSDVKQDEIPFTKIELDNIRLIKAQEQK